MIIHRNKVLACYKEGGDGSRLSATQTNPQILQNRESEIRKASHGSAWIAFATTAATWVDNFSII